MMIRNKGLHFPLFDTALAKIAEDENRELSSLEEKGNNIFSSETAEIITNVAGVYIPWADTITSAAEGIVKLGNKIKADWEKEKGPNRILYSDIAYKDGKAASEKLHEYFVKDAYEVFEKRETPYVIFLDGYEKFVNRLTDGNKAEYYDYWMYEEPNGLIYLPNTIWVIAGRNKLHWPEEVLSQDSCHRIGDLSEEDTSLFLTKAGINDEILIKDLFKLTQGTPAFLDLCVDNYNIVIISKTPTIEDFGNNTEKLAQRYLESMDSSKQLVLRMLSCFPNVWSNAMAEAIAERLGYGNIKMILEDLLPLSIFEKFQEGNRLHETVREVVRRNTPERNIIEKEILKYSYENIYIEDSWDVQRYFIRLFSIYIVSENNKLFSNDELTELLRYTNKIILLHGDYYLQEDLINGLIKFLDNNDYMSEATIVAKTMQIDNLYRLGNYRDGVILGEQTYEIAIKLLGKQHSETINCLSYLGKCYQKNGQHEKALVIAQECFEQRKNQYGLHDVNTADSLFDISNVYAALGQYEKALPFALQCYEVRKVVLGEDNIDTLESLNAIGNRYLRLGDFIKLNDIYTKVYEQRKKYLGENHPDTLASMNNLAIVYYRFGKYEKALESDKKCYSIKADVLGYNHPATLKSCQNIALRTSRLGNYNIAFEIYEDSYNRLADTLGENNPSTLYSLSGMAKNLMLMGKYEQAEMLGKKCLEIRKKILGDSNLYTLISMSILGEIYMCMGENEKAVELLEQGYQIKNQGSSKNIPEGLEMDYSYGKILMIQGKYEKALQIQEHCLLARKEVYFEKHFDILFSMNIIGEIYYQKGNYEKAYEYTNNSYELRKETLGEKHPETLESMFNLGLIFMKTDREKKAKEVMQECLKYRREMLGDKHPKTLECYKYV